MITPEYRLTFPTQLGVVRVTAVPRGIAGIEFAEKEEERAGGLPRFMDECVEQLEQYFDGSLKDFHSLPMVWRATDFQQAVWEAASEIPFGETRTYGELADAIGHPGASRAVGTALSRNPLCIIIPCHRIIPAGGNIAECGQYAGGEWRKRWLLNHETPVKQDWKNGSTSSP